MAYMRMIIAMLVLAFPVVFGCIVGLHRYDFGKTCLESKCLDSLLIRKAMQ